MNIHECFFEVGEREFDDALKQEVSAVALEHPHRLNIDQVVGLFLAFRLEKKTAIVRFVASGKFGGKREHRPIDPAIEYVPKLQHVAEVESGEALVDVVKQQPNREQMVGLRFASFACGERA